MRKGERKRGTEGDKEGEKDGEGGGGGGSRQTEISSYLFLSL